MWKQNGYQDKEPELKKVILKFLNVTNYNWDSEKDEKDIDYDSIINITCTVVRKYLRFSYIILTNTNNMV